MSFLNNVDIFLKYISDSFEELYNKIQSDEGDFTGANPEDADEYRAENVFFVPQIARWSSIHARAKQPNIGKDLDDAMEAIEKENPTLKGILPKVYARPNLDKTALGGLIDLIGNIAIGTEAAKSKDLLGRVYDPACGSGEMFIMSEKFVESHQGKVDDIPIVI